jgi:hypothetical protein
MWESEKIKGHFNLPQAMLAALKMMGKSEPEESL